MDMDRRKPAQEQPFLANDGSTLDIELSQLEDDPHDNDRTIFNYYHEPKPSKSGTRSPLLITLALLVTVLGFVVNTEATEYVESTLGWKKPMATMYITHSSLALPWMIHLLNDRFRKRDVSYTTWVRDYNNRLRESISTIDAYATNGPYMMLKRQGQVGGPLDFLATVMAIVTAVLTVSGCSWFIALAFTTPADLTAIYNCSTFFAAAFSVPILKERLGRYSIIAVLLSIVGTFVIAYGDTTAEHPPDESNAASKVGTSRLFGNVIASVGALAFGLYEVLFKKWACSSRPSDPKSSLPLTLAASALTGVYTFATLWVFLVALHFVGIETLEWPSLRVWAWLTIAVISGVVSITTLAVLVVWTDPVFGSFANVLSMAFVAFNDWLIFGLAPSMATYIGGGVVVLAFGLLSWETFYRSGPR